VTASRRPWVRLGSVLAGVALAASGLWAWHAARSPAGPGSAVPVPVGWARPAVAAGDLGQASGVTITRVAVTGGGGLVDLRCRIGQLMHRADADAGRRRQRAGCRGAGVGRQGIV